MFSFSFIEQSLINDTDWSFRPFHHPLQNLHWKLGWLTPSFGSTLAVRLKKHFFRNIFFLFFKIESWNFQHLFEIEFRETSQNFNSFSLFRQLLFSFFLSVVWLSWNFVRFHEILFQTDSESFSFLSWKTKKFYSPKKIFLSHCQYQNKKALFTDPIFSEGFGTNSDISLQDLYTMTLEWPTFFPPLFLFLGLQSASVLDNFQGLDFWLRIQLYSNLWTLIKNGL